MSKNLLIVISVVIVVTAIGWLMSKEDTPTQQLKPAARSSVFETDFAVTNSTQKENIRTPETSSTPVQQAGNEEDNPLADENFKSQIVNIAYQYSQTAQYPIGSQPITNPSDVRDPEPFEETETTTPFSTESGPVDLSAAVDKYQYFDGETIELQLQLTGNLADAYLSAEAFITDPSDRNKAAIPFNLSPTKPDSTSFSGIFDTSSLSKDDFAPEMLIEITVNVDNEPLFTTLNFRYNEASAKLISLGTARPNGPNLDIPLNFDVSQKGYYFVRAVLEDQKTRKPLIALQQEGKMRKGRDEIVLQAHIQALKASDSEGPYVLRSFDIYRGAEQGEQFDVSGTSEEKQFAFSGFPFSRYIDEPHQDSLAEERAEFLLSLGALDDKQ
jgi:hypothetical protein